MYAHCISSALQTSASHRFQFMSDLHLELGQQYSSFNFATKAPFLILAGDIGCLLDYKAYLGFIFQQTMRYERVFLVLDNHEFYGLEYDEAIAKAKALENEKILCGRLTLLHRTHFSIPGSNITILGCTLWSNIPDKAREAVRGRVKDYRNITNWTVDNHNAAHQADLAWLTGELEEIEQDNSATERLVLVVSHHAPSVQETSRPKNLQNPWTPAFATDLLGSRSWRSVKCWIFGHTHYTTNSLKVGVRVMSNQRGYVLPGASNESPGSEQSFDAGKVLQV